MLEINIPEEFRIVSESSSDGTQEKYFYKGYWYKVDKCGGEGLTEEISSILMSCSSLLKDDYIVYESCIVNGKVGCRSENFLKPDEELFSFNKAHELITGCSIGKAILGKPPQTKIEYVIDFFEEYYTVNVSEYLSNVLTIDKIIRNDDRNFGNLGIIYSNGIYKPAPIFDCGNSLLVGLEPYKHTDSLEQRINFVQGKPFVSNLDIQASLLPSKIVFDFDKYIQILNGYSDSLQKSAALFLANKYYEEFKQNKELNDFEYEI